MSEKKPTLEPSPDEEALLRRLRRIEGQIRGLQRMVAQRRDCHDTITQLLAVRSALNQVGLMLLNDYLDRCLPVTDEASPQVDRAALQRIVNLWARLGSQ